MFGLQDAAPVGQRRVFLTQVRDPQGHAVTLTYDAQYRIVAITDALGQVSTLQYESAGDTRRITGVPLYVQRPGESRVWYAYPGQSRTAPTLLTGWATTPAVVARVLDDGTTQQTQASVNTLGQVTGADRRARTAHELYLRRQWDRPAGGAPDDGRGE